MTVLKDDTKMPFGQYAHLSMQDVPAPYLLWLYDKMLPKAPNKRNLSEKHLIEYIEDNKAVLEKQNKESHKPYIKP